MSAGRQTFTSLQTEFLDSTGNPGSTDTTLLAYFSRHLGIRYQEDLARLSNYKTEAPIQTASTVASQAGYHNPPGLINIEAMNIDIGDMNIPLQVVNSQKVWDHLNSLTTTGFPTHFFPRRDDFLLYPIPDAVYTINFGSHSRDRILTTADFTTGTITVTNNDETITHSATGFTALMVGRWFKVDQDGYWYRIASFTSTSSMELETKFEGSSGSALTFVIGESPELPEEVHIALAYGVTSDWYRSVRKDKKTADDFESRHEEIIEKAIEKYASRSDSPLVRRNITKTNNHDNILWGKTITDP